MTRDSKKAYKKARKLEVAQFISQSKMGKPCEICRGIYKPWQMQYDHLDPKMKTRNVSQASTISAAMREIAKCRLLCANCHADVTYTNWRDYRGILEPMNNQIELFNEKVA